MNSLEDLLTQDDQNLGSFGILEKGIGYTTLFCLTVPVLLTPFLYHFLGKSFFKLFIFLLGCLLVLYIILRFRFSWIVVMSYHLKPLYA